MTFLHGQRGFIRIARSLILALGLAFAVESLPLEAAPVQACAVASDCLLSPSDSPRERSDTLFIVGVASENLQSEALAQIPASSPPVSLFALQSVPLAGLDKGQGYRRGEQALPDKTGPPCA